MSGSSNLRCNNFKSRIVEMGQKRWIPNVRAMSGYTPIASAVQTARHFGFVPGAVSSLSVIGDDGREPR